MREHYTNVLRSFFHRKLRHRRSELGISQEEMASRLAMASRSYADLDHGKTGCRGLTLALFLIYICADPLAFLEELQTALENSDQHAA